VFKFAWSGVTFRLSLILTRTIGRLYPIAFRWGAVSVTICADGDRRLGSSSASRKARLNGCILPFSDGEAPGMPCTCPSRLDIEPQNVEYRISNIEGRELPLRCENRGGRCGSTPLRHSEFGVRYSTFFQHSAFHKYLVSLGLSRGSRSFRVLGNRFEKIHRNAFPGLRTLLVFRWGKEKEWFCRGKSS